MPFCHIILCKNDWNRNITSHFLLSYYCYYCCYQNNLNKQMSSLLDNFLLEPLTCHLCFHLSNHIQHVGEKRIYVKRRYIQQPKRIKMFIILFFSSTTHSQAYIRWFFISLLRTRKMNSFLCFSRFVLLVYFFWTDKRLRQEDL